MLPLSLNKGLHLLFERPSLWPVGIQREGFIDRAKRGVVGALVQRRLGARERRRHALFPLTDRRNLLDRLAHLPPEVGRSMYVGQRRRGFLRHYSRVLEVAVGEQTLRLAKTPSNRFPFDGQPGSVDQRHRLATIGICRCRPFGMLESGLVIVSCKRFLGEAQLFLDLLPPEFRQSFR